MFYEFLNYKFTKKSQNIICFVFLIETKTDKKGQIIVYFNKKYKLCKPLKKFVKKIGRFRKHVMNSLHVRKRVVEELGNILSHVGLMPICFTTHGVKLKEMQKKKRKKKSKLSKDDKYCCPMITSTGGGAFLIKLKEMQKKAEKGTPFFKNILQISKTSSTWYDFALKIFGQGL